MIIFGVGAASLVSLVPLNDFEGILGLVSLQFFGLFFAIWTIPLQKVPFGCFSRCKE